MQFTVNAAKESVLFRRGMTLFFHIFGITLSFWLAIQLRFDFSVPEGSVGVFRKQVVWVVSGFVAAILVFRLYRGLWRFFTLLDCVITALAIITGAVFACIAVYLGNGGTFQGMPRSTLIISALLFLLWEIGWRGVIRLVREHRMSRRSGGEWQGVLLMGNPDNADALLRQMLRYPGKIGEVVGLVSNSPRHSGHQLRGVRIYGVDDDITALVKEKMVSTILFLPPLTGVKFIRDAMEALSSEGLKCDYRVMPSVDDLASGRINVEKMRRVSIEDLLHRPTHDLDLERVKSTIDGKRVMVTGAGGSIGSEICRQVLELGPKLLILFEASEFLLFEIERELSERAADLGVKLVGVAGDVRRIDQVRRAIDRDGVDVLYHAAAYKHVDLMERNPMSCFQNNVIGTECVARVAEEEGVEVFVLISTDKAVRPTSLMGASKRLAERVLIERPSSSTRFCAVRFGNVLGSSGSVIPIFKKQIAEGGPVTVTSKEVTRYFMTIPEAVELVIAAGAFADDRQICVLEMGEPVKIDSLARRMIELSGFVPDVEVPIVYTGLKSGEKEYEELLTDDEGVVRTDHDRIWVLEKSNDVMAPPLDLGDLLELLDDGNEKAIRKYAHRNVPGSLLMEKTKAKKR